MRKRLVAGAAVVALGFVAVMPVHAATGLPDVTGSAPAPAVNASTPALCLPAIAGVTSPDSTGKPQQFGPEGATVTVTGANFSTTALCSLTAVKVGAATIAAADVTVNAGGTALTFKLPAGASGPVTVVETEQIGGAQDSSNSNVVFIETPAATVQSPTPLEGSPEPVAGTGYAPFLAPTAGGLPGATVTGTYTGCSGGDRAQPAAASSDTSLQLSAPATYCDGALTLVFHAPADTAQPIDCTAGSPTYNCISVSVVAGTIDVFFFISSLNPPPFSTVHPGDTIRIEGSGFGSSGQADLAGILAKVRWSDGTILVTVPNDATTGLLTVQRASGDLQALQLGSYIVPGTTPGGPGGTGGPGPTPNPVPGGPIIGPNGVPIYGVPLSHAGGVHGSTPPSGHPSVRDALTLSLDTAQAAAGAKVRFLVTLTVNGKPVSGAPVTISILSAPDKDASLSPTSGITDSKGAFSGVLQLSHKAGDHLLLATSGIYSDEAHVVGQPVAASTGAGLPFGLGGLRIHISGNPLVVWLSVATGLLVLFGILVNVEVLRRVLWSLTVGRFIHRWRTTRGAA